MRQTIAAGVARQDIARSTAKIALPVAVLIVALGCDSPTAPIAAPTGNITPTALPAPASITYNVSGIVTDDNGSPIANAQLTLYYDNSFKSAKTSTDAHGYYSIIFESAQRSYDGNADVAGAIFYTGGGDYENHHVQAVPSGTADIVKNLHLRRVRKVNAGQSVVVSIDPDSSLAYDGEDWMRMDSVWEKFHVQVADAGTLTVVARTEAGGTAPSLAVFCVYVADNCHYDWVKEPRGSGTGAVRVKADSLFEIRLAIPSRMAPQRYVVETSLQ